MPYKTSSFVVVAITHDEARVWNSGLEPDSKPLRLHAAKHFEFQRNPRKGQHNIERGPNEDDVQLFDEVAVATTSAQEILVYGHGTGKSSHMNKMVQHWKQKHPELAKLVVGTVNIDLSSVTEPELLAAARHWFDRYHEYGF